MWLDSTVFMHLRVLQALYCRLETQLVITKADNYSLALVIDKAPAVQWNLEVVADLPLLQNTKIILPEIPTVAGQLASFAFFLIDPWANSVSNAGLLDLNGTTLEGPSLISASKGDIRYRCF